MASKELGHSNIFSATTSLYDVSEASSDWGRDYEDEATWYEYPTDYEVGLDTRLVPSKDVSLSLRMASNRRSSSSRRSTSGRSSAKVNIFIIILKYFDVLIIFRLDIFYFVCLFLFYKMTFLI